MSTPPKTAIANRLRGQVFSINNENDERTMLSEIICAGSKAFAEDYISECDTFKHDDYVKNLEETAKEAYKIYLDKSLYVLKEASLEYIKNQIKEQANPNEE